MTTKETISKRHSVDQESFISLDILLSSFPTIMAIPSYREDISRAREREGDNWNNIFCIGTITAKPNEPPRPLLVSIDDNPTTKAVYYYGFAGLINNQTHSSDEIVQDPGITPFKPSKN